MSLLAIIWTTVFLTWIQTYLVPDDVEDLALAYLLPMIFIAVFFGSTLAVAGSFVSALAAASALCLLQRECVSSSFFSPNKERRPWLLIDLRDFGVIRFLWKRASEAPVGKED